MKVYLVNTEENELVFIAEISAKLMPKYDLTKKINNDIPKCYVLTDKNFLIQSQQIQKDFLNYFLGNY